MCMVYNDIDYHHGLCVIKQTETGARCFDILVTKHIENQPYRYSGICLNNGYEVCTDEYAKSTALIELLEKIVGDTFAFEKEYTLQNPGKYFTPLVNIKDNVPALYDDFSNKMKDARLLNEYDIIHEALKPFLEKPRFNPSSNASESEPIKHSKLSEEMVTTVLTAQQLENIYDCKDMYLTWHLLKNNETLKNCEVKYSRV